MSIKSLLGVILAAALSGAAMADNVQLTEDHPDRYTVVKGDTLWGIAGRFLEEPWKWPEVWEINPQIANPHLIYPGDVIHLEWVDGKPKLRLSRGGARPTYKLSPEGRILPLDTAIPTIPADAIRGFLTRTRPVDEAELDEAGYLLATPDEHLLISAGDRFHARALDEQAQLFTIVRAGREYRDPDIDDEQQALLGREAIHLGEARLESGGDPATLRVTRSNRAIQIGDRLLPADETAIERDFLPRAPESEIDGKIIDVIDGLTQIGQFQIVVLNRGVRDGLRTGDVLAAYQSGREAKDPVLEEQPLVKLPDQRAGEMLVFRAFDRLSYALVMESRRPLHTGDAVRNP